MLAADLRVGYDQEWNEIETSNKKWYFYQPVQSTYVFHLGDTQKATCHVRLGRAKVACNTL